MDRLQLPTSEVDVVVLGSGAAGLVAALAAHESGATVALFEKAELIGGSTAISGGVCWVPMNHHMDEAGAPDSREAALAYLRSLSLGQMNPALAEAFIGGARESVEWLESVTDLEFTLIPGYPDYHPEHPGGRPASACASPTPHCEAAPGFSMTRRSPIANSTIFAAVVQRSSGRCSPHSCVQASNPSSRLGPPT